MKVKEQLIAEIDHLDEQYLELLYKIVCQFPRLPRKNNDILPGKQIADAFQELADGGGLGIVDPQEWQRKNREDRPLPFRDS